MLTLQVVLALCVPLVAAREVEPTILEGELMSFSQVEAELASSTGLVGGRKYHEVLTAEELVAKIRTSIDKGQKRDYDEASVVVANLERDIVELTDQHARKNEVFFGASGKFNDTQAAYNHATSVRTNLTREIAENGKILTQTTAECQDMQAKHLRNTAGNSADAAEVAAVLNTVLTVDCSELGPLVETLHLPATAAEALALDGAVALLELQATTETHTMPPDLGESDHAPFLNQYGCDARRHKITQLLRELKEQLSTASATNARTFEKSLQACYVDMASQDTRLSAATAELQIVTREYAMLKDAHEKAQIAFEVADADKRAALRSLEASKALRSAERCQYRRRATLRSQQNDDVNKVLHLLRDLTRSNYSSQHLDLANNCPDHCNAHGVCLHGGCVCERGYSGATCGTAEARSCPFQSSAHNSPCNAPSCAVRDFNHMAKHSGCANVTCAYCASSGAFDPGCAAAPMAMFCAEAQRQRGCGSVTCPHTSEECGAKRVVKRPFTACCFNDKLDCVDACADTVCPSSVDPETACGAGLAVRHPYRACCFEPEVDCVDECAVATCDPTPPQCPAGMEVRTPFAGCCFDPVIDCEDECVAVVCPLNDLPIDICRARGERWRGSTVGCCFEAEVDCSTGDDEGQEPDRRALMAMYQSLNGVHWARQANWNTDKWVCYWEGVDCQGKAGHMRVSSITLVSNGLMGQLPDEIKMVTQLKSLDVSGNELSGPLPIAMSNLTKLAAIKVRGNRLSGQIPPTVQRMQQLELLDLAFNFFSGSLENGLLDRANITVTCTGNCMCSMCLPLRAVDDLHNPNHVACPACP